MRVTVGNKSAQMQKFRDWCYNVHDVEVNQKYGNSPYSTHLNFVAQQAIRFQHLVKINDLDNGIIVEAAAYGHDLIEDGRQSYNDIVGKAIDIFNDDDLALKIGNVIYAVTDEKGKHRGARKNDKFYEELSANQLAVYVKLCDMAANTLFSLLSNSSMHTKYKKEFPKFKEKTYEANKELKELFDFVERL